MPSITTTVSTSTLSIIFLILASALYANEPTDEAVLRIDSNLYETARTDAKVTASLKSGTKVKIIERKHAWYQVKYGPILQGWLPLQNLQLKVGKGFTAYIDHLPKPAKVVESDDDGSDAPVTGIRALSSQNLNNIEPDFEAVKALERFAVDKDQASDFASELGLKARKLEYLVKAEEEKEAPPTKEANEEDF